MTSVHARETPIDERQTKSDSLLAYRERFPILERTNYLISNSLGAVPAKVGPSLQSYFETWATRGVRAWEEGWWTMAADTGDLVAPLIGANAGEVVFQPNVTIAHAALFSAIDYGGKRDTIVTDAMHFPSILYLIGQQRRLGANVTIVPSDDGISVDTGRIIEAIDEKTAFVNLSHVLFKSAYIHDIAAIAEQARRMEAITIIDGYQAVGTIPVDVRAAGIDAYVGGCLKWLCGGPGNAFVWVRPDLRRQLEPKLTGWMTHQRPFAFEPELSAATMSGGCSTARQTFRGCTRRVPGSRSSTKSVSRRFVPSRYDRPAASWSWPRKRATAARLRVSRRTEQEQ